MSNLLKLLQPPTYKSKIKLYCREKEYKIEKYSKTLAQLKEKPYICRIKIQPLKDEQN